VSIVLISGSMYMLQSLHIKSDRSFFSGVEVRGSVDATVPVLIVHHSMFSGKISIT
jgi:hypothetical protein